MLCEKDFIGDAGKGQELQAKDCRLPLKAGKGSETDSSLNPSEGSATLLTDTLILTP